MARPSSPPLTLQELETRTQPSATLLADIHPGYWGSYPSEITVAGARAFFRADNGHGNELYVTDGTAAGTRLVKDIKPGLGGSNPHAFLNAGSGVVFFLANDGTGDAVWRSDGTAAGTVKVNLPAGARYGVNPQSVQGSPEGVVAGLDGELYFAAPDFEPWGEHGEAVEAGEAVYRTDGLSPAVKAVDISPSGFWGMETSASAIYEQGGRVYVETNPPGEYLPWVWETQGDSSTAALLQNVGFDSATFEQIAWLPRQLTEA